MRHIVGLFAAGLVLFVVFRGFFGSFWRKPPSPSDSTPADWSSYGGEGSGGHSPSDGAGNT